MEDKPKTLETLLVKLEKQIAKKSRIRDMVNLPIYKKIIKLGPETISPVIISLNRRLKRSNIKKITRIRKTKKLRPRYLLIYRYTSKGEHTFPYIHEFENHYLMDNHVRKLARKIRRTIHYIELFDMKVGHKHYCFVYNRHKPSKKIFESVFTDYFGDRCDEDDLEQALEIFSQTKGIKVK